MAEFENVQPLYRHAQSAPELTAIVDRLNGSGYEYEGWEVTPQNAAAVVNILLQQLDDAVQSANSKPVKRVNADQMQRVCLEANRHLDKYGAMAREVNKLLGHIPAQQPAPVVMDDRKLRALFDSWFASDCSFDLSQEASEADNIAWRESYWYVWKTLPRRHARSRAA
ncbi:Uncharacterised protein [Klebsiella pneumoniae subsp. ozaenae]|uniref:Uncharacterized protein n=1 Tax=Klebsiella pneumoniae subsp. ozaenae TaxID=574 RepID=A0A378ACH1_KLEPO|nr:Uncharacterised protein [Klebsiella pneumoniae subsp. ozaenae]